MPRGEEIIAYRETRRNVGRAEMSWDGASRGLRGKAFFCSKRGRRGENSYKEGRNDIRELNEV